MDILVLNDEFEKVWMCRSCQHRFVPFRKHYACPKCYSESTKPTNEDSLLKKSETHSDAAPKDPIKIISEELFIENQDLESVYNKCVSWLRQKGAKITATDKPAYISSMHTDFIIAVEGSEKDIKIHLSSFDDGVRLKLDIYRPVAIPVGKWTTVFAPPRKYHHYKIRAIASIRKKWKEFAEELLRYLSVENEA